MYRILRKFEGHEFELGVDGLYHRPGDPFHLPVMEPEFKDAVEIAVVEASRIHNHDLVYVEDTTGEGIKMRFDRE